MKRRHQQKNFSRVQPKQEINCFYLILTQGKNTETDYFNHYKKIFKNIHLEVVTQIQTSRKNIKFAGNDPLGIVEGITEHKNLIVKEFIKENGFEKDFAFDEIWVVFDRDNFEKQFDNAIEKAKHNDIKVAYSNQAFEYWLLLHFENHDGEKLDRKDYDKRLNDYLSEYDIHYDGQINKHISEDFFQLLRSPDSKYQNQLRKDLAIKRAKRIFERHEKEGKPFNQRESSTSVFLLIEKIDPPIDQKKTYFKYKDENYQQNSESPLSDF